jgi:hypothetical protein
VPSPSATLESRGRLARVGGIALIALAGSLAPAEESGRGHELRSLLPLEGSWSIEGKWKGSDGKPLRANGISENRWILGGRYLQCDASAEGPAGERAESRIILGYDPRNAHYFALILDNQNSYYLQPTGTYSAASRSFILSGKERDEASGLAVTYRVLVRLEGSNRYVVELFFDTGGPAPVSWFEVVYTRREASP